MTRQQVQEKIDSYRHRRDMHMRYARQYARRGEGAAVRACVLVARSRNVHVLFWRAFLRNMAP